MHAALKTSMGETFNEQIDFYVMLFTAVFSIGMLWFVNDNKSSKR
jgi:hypothetical protein